MGELRAALLAAPKFGNDDDYTDLIAADIAKQFCAWVSEFCATRNADIWPALICFMFVQEAYWTGATPDGRRWTDPIAEHYSPVPGRAKKGPTAVISSAAKGPLSEACGGSPVQISLSRTTVPRNSEGLAIMKALCGAAADSGYLFMNIAVYDEERLRGAQRHPEGKRGFDRPRLGLQRAVH